MTNTSHVNFDIDIYSKQLTVNVFVTGQSDRTLPAFLVLVHVHY